MYDPTKPYKKQILEAIQQTWDTKYVNVRKNIYPTIEKKFSYPEVDHTDGIGTKGIFHWKKRTFRNACLDALAMNLNDLALIRAIPYKLQNHIILPEDDKEAILELIRVLSEECKKRDIAITGGETSIHDNIVGMEISLTVSGFIKNLKPNRFQVGEVLIGMESNGLHSNGFTLVRKTLGKEIENYIDELVKPTLIYSDLILKLSESFKIGGMMHITGGAFTKLKDLLFKADAIITREHALDPQEIFKELYNRGINDEQMYKTFNCGVGFVFSIAKEYAEEVLSQIKDFKADVIGKVTKGEGKVKVESKFSDVEVVY